MNEWISISQFKHGYGRNFPFDSILYRTVLEQKKTGRTRVEIIIPRPISIKAGIDIGTRVDVLYNPKSKEMRIKLLQRNEKGFNVINHNKKHVPALRVRIQFNYYDDSQLPKTDNKNMFINKYEIKDGLIFCVNGAIG